MVEPVRLAAMMELPVVFVFTHDSIGLGEDGPTHQPVEQLASLRSMPGLRVFRPADANESAQAWAEAIAHPGPSAMVLSRQGLPHMQRSDDQHGATGITTIRLPANAFTRLRLPETERQFGSVLAGSDATHVTVDLGALGHIPASGIGLLIAASVRLQARGGTLRLVNPQPDAVVVWLG